MTLTIAWWWLPVGAVVAGIVGAYALGRQRGDYDFFSSILGFFALVLGVAVAIAIVIGHALT